MGGMCSYNPWFSNMNNQFNAGGMGAFYGNQQAQMQSQMRFMQQQAVTTQDAQAAQMALYQAQTRYQQVLGNMSGSYYGGGGGYYGGGGGYYGGGYGYYNPAYSGYYAGYYPAGATVNNPPALNPVRK
jgi:hypothetical protein